MQSVFLPHNDVTMLVFLACFSIACLVLAGGLLYGAVVIPLKSRLSILTAVGDIVVGAISIGLLVLGDWALTVATAGLRRIVVEIDPSGLEAYRLTRSGARAKLLAGRSLLLRVRYSSLAEIPTLAWSNAVVTFMPSRPWRSSSLPGLFAVVNASLGGGKVRSPLVGALKLSVSHPQAEGLAEMANRGGATVYIHDKFARGATRASLESLRRWSGPSGDPP